MKLGNKILATVLAVVLVGVISQVLVQQKINLANTSVQQEQRWTERAMQGLELKSISKHQNSALAEYLIFQQAEQANHFKELSNQTKKQMEQFIQDTKREEVKQHLQKVLQNEERLIMVFNEEIQPVVAAGDRESANRIYVEKVTPLSEAIETDLGKFVEDRKKEVTQQQEIVATAGKHAVQYGFVFTVLAALIGITISLIMSRQIINPLKKLIKRAEALAEGDLTQTMDDLNQKDEIGDLARAFQKMEDELKQVISLIVTDSMTLAAHSQQMSAASQEVSANVHGIAGLTTELAATAENQAANATGASAVSREAEEVAREGGRSVQDVITKMESISSTVNNSTQVMGKLSEQSKQIGQIIEAITGIADQTNLLALNAAIEAARAGEHGKGFAVVAEEVRSLAEKSAAAAKEISTIVTEIRQDIEQAVNAMEIGAKEVNEGVVVVEKAGQSLRQIVDKVVNSSQYISEISVATEQTSDATQELAQSTDQVNSAVEQIAQSSVSLAKMAQEFSEITNHFRIHEEKQGDFWEGKEHCSETKNCREEGRNPDQCKVSKFPSYPCWNLKGTHCKGEKGNDVRQCKECEVYKKYGNNEPIVVYDDKLLESNSGIDWD
ncbi:methyl-accepting chemotaxis protein [Desulforamulus aeronauticus]|uniref:Methyl-accepting chemotaxis protein n=1 Tax=Desulforamulus aeronauticus DSM 10349 TaxID=1121421 RepID=A0A1M6TTT5_9FIRM|nr:methyl-accepting chemotaxis protein [Desulforamulus aeronauticus]SHK60412.1 methyl-accepting chemotaxis protein [Desulforamulus aeronauticus DSM 10349]